MFITLRNLTIIKCLFFIIITLSALHAQTELPLTSLNVNGATPTTIDVDNMPFTQATQVTVPQATPNPWDIQASSAVATTLNKDDVLLVTFYFRSFSQVRAKVLFRFEKFSDPYTGSVEWGVSADTTWRKASLPFSVITPEGVDQYSANEAGLRFRLGLQQQTVAIGGIKLERFPASAFDSLQLIAAQERDTTWREPARQRIEQHRKGNLYVKVLDQNGSPVVGASITATMQRHNCDFATMLDDLVLGTGSDDIQYKARVVELFNAVTQRIYWAWNWNNANSIADVFRCLAWSDSVGLTSRGHTVVYPTWQYSPPWLQSLENNPAKLRDTIEDHIADCAEQLNGRLVDWDMVNEMTLWTDVITAAGGEEHYATWYKVAKQYAPQVKAFVNEPCNIENGGMYITHMEKYKDIINLLLQEGAPMEGIGLQAHFDSYTDPPIIYAILEDFAQFNVPLRVTELDVNIANEQVQAGDLSDYLLLLFSHQKVEGITMWGFWEGNMWNDRKALVRRDWSLKPSADTWKDMIFNRWWTEPQSGTSSAAGFFSFKGFKGTYTVRVQSGPVDTSVTALLENSDDTCIVLLPITNSIIPQPISKASFSIIRLHAGNRTNYQLSVPSNTKTFEIFTIQGRKIFTQKHTTEDIQLTLPQGAGIYFLLCKDTHDRLIKSIPVVNP